MCSALRVFGEYRREATPSGKLYGEYPLGIAVVED